ncbi:MAG: hypothetical protein QOK04_177 [Solirubrobacteraceae bacterium]|jgi:hypothetical protein|nr:hypothetical protein [Solirubrobacteraceae bacterium]
MAPHLVSIDSRTQRHADNQARLRRRLRSEYLHVPTSEVAEREGVEPRLVDRLRQQEGLDWPRFTRSAINADPEAREGWAPPEGGRAA